MLPEKFDVEVTVQPRCSKVRAACCANPVRLVLFSTTNGSIAGALDGVADAELATEGVAVGAGIPADTPELADTAGPAVPVEVTDEGAGAEALPPALGSAADARATTVKTPTPTPTSAITAPTMRSQRRGGGLATGLMEASLTKAMRKRSGRRMDPSYRTSTPSRRADRCRCRLARNRRRRLTSIGSAAKAAGVSINAFSNW